MYEHPRDTRPRRRDKSRSSTSASEPALRRPTPGPGGRPPTGGERPLPPPGPALPAAPDRAQVSPAGRDPQLPSGRRRGPTASHHRQARPTGGRAGVRRGGPGPREETPRGGRGPRPATQGPGPKRGDPSGRGTPEEGRTAAVATRAETRAQPAAVTLPLGGAAMLPTSVYDDVALFTCFPSAPQQPPSAPTRPRGRRRRTRVGHAPFLPPPGRGKAPRPQGRARLGGGAKEPRPSRRAGASASGGLSSEAAGRKEEKMAGSCLALVLFGFFFLLQRLSSFRIPRTQLSARLAGAQPRGSGLPVGLSLILPLRGL